MGIPLEELIRRGAKPAGTAAQAAPRRRFTAEELAQAGAKPVDAADTGPSRTESFVRGGGQGITLGAQEEAVGLDQALADRFPWLRLASPTAWLAQATSGRPLGELFEDVKAEQAKRDAGRGQSLTDTYRQHRDVLRTENTAAEQAHPGYYLAGNIAGGALVPVPGGAAAKGTALGMRLLRAAGQGAALGAGYGLGNSTADLTQGQVGQAALDTGAGALLGGAAGAGTEAAITGVGKALGAVRARAAAGIKDAIEAIAAKNEALASKNIASATGTARSSVQSASRDVEVIAREAAALPDGDPAKQQLLDFLNSEDGLKLRRSVALNKLKTAPDRIAEMNGAWKTVDDLTANKEASVELMNNEETRDVFNKHVRRRLNQTLKAAVPALASSALGAMLGGGEGAGIGMMGGSLISMALGDRGRAWTNMIRQPAVRKSLWGLLQSGVGGAEGSSLLGRTAQGAAARGQNVIDLNSARLSPEAQALLQRVAAAQTDEERRNALAAR